MLNFISPIAIFGNKDPFSEENHATYHLFIDSFLSQIDSEVKIRKFNQSLKEIMIQIFTEKNNNDKVIATYFYDLISEDVGICNAWETLISGNGQYLDNKAATILNVIISIVRHQGFERFYVLIDEFEDLTSGRLTKKEVDDYTYNLRTLIDKERRWCILITLTSRALHELKNISPPLVERLTDRIIKINRLSNEEAMKLIQNHLHLVKKDNDDSLYPFTRESITYLNNGAKGLPRLFLRQSYSVLEKAIEGINGDEMITAEFVRLSR